MSNETKQEEFIGFYRHLIDLGRIDNANGMHDAVASFLKGDTVEKEPCNHEWMNLDRVSTNAWECECGETLYSFIGGDNE